MNRDECLKACLRTPQGLGLIFVLDLCVSTPGRDFDAIFGILQGRGDRPLFDKPLITEKLKYRNFSYRSGRRAGCLLVGVFETTLPG